MKRKQGLLKNGQPYIIKINHTSQQEEVMNDKFYNLPKEKQQAIINAGYRVFSQNSYKKSPMQEIADAAGISKSLLFHYFQNKKELYLFLWETCGKISVSVMTEYGCYDRRDLFEMMERGLAAKIHIMKKYPFMGSFVIRAFYESDPVIRPEIEKSYTRLISLKAAPSWANLDPKQFIEDVPPERILREMYLVSEGYLWELQQKGAANTENSIEKIESDFREMITFWKKIYLRKKG